MRYLLLAIGLLTAPLLHADQTEVRFVNFKKCVEGSKLGKQEQGKFDALKKQMETNLLDKEKTLNEMATKFEDQDFLESLSPEAETELKRKFRTLNQEYTTLQNQYLQALQQTNYKVVQKLTEIVGKASANVAQRKKLQFILNDEATFFASPDKDVSTDVIAAMDELYDSDSTLREGTVPSVNSL